MGRRRGGNLKKTVEGANDSVSKKKRTGSNKNPNQELTGVTLPADGTIQGWQFGGGVTMACANVGGKYYAVAGECPRCAFDLWKGDLITDDEAWDETPRVACPTCSYTFSMRTGKYGPPLKRTGLAGFVSGLARTATEGDKPKNAQAFQITQDEEERVFCRKLPMQ